MADSGRARGPPRRRARVDRRQGGVMSKHADPHELVLPKPSPVPLAPRDPDKRPPSVGPKVKAAIAALLSSARPSLYDAAKTAGLRTYDLREALKSPHVRRYFDEERQAVIEAFAGANPAALAEIRDTSPNENAKVNAAKALEAMRETGREIARGGSASEMLRPGLVIQINQVTAAPAERPAITITPQPEPEPEPERVEDAGFGVDRGIYHGDAGS